MSKIRSFNKPPLSAMEKEKKAEEFLNFFPAKNNRNDSPEQKIEIRNFKKEDVKPLALRFPKSLAEDIAEISALTGLSMNAICVELLRPAAKLKLKDIKG